MRPAEITPAVDPLAHDPVAIRIATITTAVSTTISTMNITIRTDRCVGRCTDISRYRDRQDSLCLYELSFLLGS